MNAYEQKILVISEKWNRTVIEMRAQIIAYNKRKNIFFNFIFYCKTIFLLLFTIARFNRFWADDTLKYH